MSAMLPSVRVSARGAARLRAGQIWIWRQELASTLPAAPGVVRVLDTQGRLLGTALSALASPVALRLLSTAEVEVDRAFLRQRLAAALARRQALFPDGDAYRVVHADADGLPGVVVDRFADALCLQTSCEAMDAREPELVGLLEELFSPRLLVIRDDGSARDFEGLPRRKQVARGGESTLAVYHEGRLELETDLLSDSKTGAFLDQRENHLAVARYARGEVLDAFTYHGGFALALAAAGAARVEGFDQSAAAVARARANAHRNRLGHAAFDQGNAFDLLRSLEAAGRRFDVVVLDPPALAKRQSTHAATLRGYRELNLRAMRLLRPDGILVSCSCSARLRPSELDDLLLAAARDARRQVQILERRGASRDHPTLLGLPESEYLKCHVLRVL
jgi:23S rRNA (cytosine1962-C5)-methyltransferase